MKKILILIFLLYSGVAFSQNPITTYKTRVDTSITNKTGPKSISPITVGSRLKEAADLIGKTFDSTYRSNDTLYIRQSTGTLIPIPLGSILNQYSTKQVANSWYNKSRLDTLGIGKDATLPLDVLGKARIEDTLFSNKHIQVNVTSGLSGITIVRPLHPDSIFNVTLSRGSGSFGTKGPSILLTPGSASNVPGHFILRTTPDLFALRNDLSVLNGTVLVNDTGSVYNRLTTFGVRAKTANTGVTTIMEVNDSSGAVPALVVADNNRVGVRTRTPAFDLDVNGTMKIKTTPIGSSADSVVVKDQATGQLKVIDQSAIVSSGGLQLVNISKADLNTLRTTNNLDTTKLYRVTDATTQSIPIYVKATSNSLLDKHVIVRGYDYTDATYDITKDTIVLTDRIFGVIRCIAGVWSFIGNSHDNENIDSVTIDVAASNRLKVYFTKRGYYTGVGNIVSGVDNNYPFYNINAGASVSLDYFYIDMYQSMNIQDSIWWASGATFGKKTADVTSLSWNAGTSTLTVNHVPFITTTNWPLMTSLGGYRQRVTSISSTAFTMQFYDAFNNLVTTLDSDCKFLFSRTSPNQLITNYATFASQPTTNLWIQGWMHKSIN